MYKCKQIAFAAIVLTFSFFISCQKDVTENINSQEPPTDLSAKVISGKISGFVTNEQNLPVQHATVMVGNQNTTTNQYGYFEVFGAQVTKYVGTVVVSQPGYFKGIRSFIANEGSSTVVRIQLIPKTISGTINATDGGTITLPNGLSIIFPSNGIINASSGAAYSGTVQVSSSWINPVGNDLWLTMPGDLRGLNEGGTLKLLTTYGMAAVELTGSAGELLQMAPGNKATLSMPIPSSIAAQAPATIPLWYFDETKGLWNQEGRATKTGNNYIGDVAHFSFWNCDTANNFIQLSLTVKDENGNPVPNAIVKLTANNAPNQVAYGYTNVSGYVQGAVPSNASMLMEIFGTYTNCNTPSLSQSFTTGNSNQNLGDIFINFSSAFAGISGNLINCSGTPVTNGSVMIIENGWYNQYPINVDGSFSFTRLLCSGTASISLIGIDDAAAQQSSTQNITLSPGAYNAGAIQACGISNSKFINYSIDGGTTISLVSPDDSLGLDGNGGTSGSYYVAGSNNGVSNNISFSFSANGVAAGSVQNLLNFWTNSLSQSLTIPNPTCVNITEFGAIGEFIAGNFNTSVIDGATTHNVSVSFRLLRTF